VEYVQLWHALYHIQLQLDREDIIIWNFKQDGKFTTGSAYHTQIHWINDDKFQTIDLESLGTAKMQILWVARHPKQNLDLR
jgi:hypothetical protein